jgi:intracellular septation protein
MNPVAKAPASPSLVKILLDLGPLILFFLANWQFGLTVATAVLMGGTVISLAIGYARDHRVAMMPLVTCIGVMIFGGLTLAFENDLFIKIKPTIIYLIMASILGVGLFLGRPFVRNVFQTAFQLTDTGWRLLTYRVIAFLVSLAILNEIVWRNVSSDTWVAVKVWGFSALSMVFLATQLPFIMKHEVKPQESPEAPAAD